MLCAKRLLLAQLVLAVLAGLLQLGSGVREGSSVVTPKLLKLKEQQAEQDAEWKPMDLAAFAPLAKLRGVERHGMDNAEVFEQLDTDGSGTLSKSEVAGLKELVEKYVEKKRSSQNPEDMVTYEEFEAKFQPGGEYEADTWLDREYKADGGLPHIFNRLDVDKDHQLSPDEIQHLGYFLGRESGVRTHTLGLLRTTQKLLIVDPEALMAPLAVLPTRLIQDCMFPYVCMTLVQGIKLNEDALYLEIYDQEVPSESNSPKPDL